MFSLEKVLVTGLAFVGGVVTGYAFYHLTHNVSTTITVEETTTENVAVEDDTNSSTADINNSDGELENVDFSIKTQYWKMMYAELEIITDKFNRKVITYDEMSKEIQTSSDRTLEILSKYVKDNPRAMCEYNFIASMFDYVPREKKTGNDQSQYPEVDELVNEIIKNRDNIELPPQRTYNKLSSPRLSNKMKKQLT